MPIFQLFSKRQGAIRGQMDDVFSYENPPQELRVKIVHIMDDGLGDQSEYLRSARSDYNKIFFDTYKLIVDILCREYGVFILHTGDKYDRDYYLELANFIIKEKDTEKFIDAVELVFKSIDKIARDYQYRGDEKANSAIEEINYRFKEHNFGYQYQDGQIVRVDSEFIHTEIIKPALQILGSPLYVGAKQEFLLAHEHYRHGRNKEALSDALKALESTMKVICSKRKWQYNQQKDGASRLIEICFKNNLIPNYLQSYFSGLRATLESGVPIIRNKLGSHGQGTEIINVPSYLVAYTINQTASAIIFLIEAEKNIK